MYVTRPIVLVSYFVPLITLVHNNTVTAEATWRGDMTVQPLLWQLYNKSTVQLVEPVLELGLNWGKPT